MMHKLSLFLLGYVCAVSGAVFGQAFVWIVFLWGIA